MRNRVLLFVFFLFISNLLSAATEKYRIMWREDPSTTICIGWSQIGGSTATVYYDTTDHGGNLSAFRYSHGVDRSTSHKGMDHRFSRINGLQANTAYYFYIEDVDGPSQVFWFKTAPDNSYETLSIIAGGDSRNNRVPRQKANYLVSRMRPHAVFFGGDMTDGNSNSEWRDWLDDWQLTIGSDGRMIPIIAARGNHEQSNDDIINIFDTPGPDVYFALNFGGDLLRAYTLNSMIFAGGSQNSWLDNDLSNNSHFIWTTAQYHLPTRPHVSTKLDNPVQYATWAQTFNNHHLTLAIECDAHCVKTTWPIVPDLGLQSDEGFIRDDVNGTVYTGEGCWGAPLRSANDNKDWTRVSGSFNQFKWILIDRYKMEIRTVKVENAYSVGLVNDADICTPPANLDVWDPGNGNDVIIIENNLQAPDVTLLTPEDGLFYVDRYPIQLSATAQANNGSGIERVAFFANGQEVAADSTAPYSLTWIPDAFGNYVVYAKAIDNNGETSKSERVNIAVGISEHTENMIDGDNDAEMYNHNGAMYLNSDVLDLVEENYTQKVGLRFPGVPLPKEARLIDARIFFTASQSNSGSTTFDIRTQTSVNPAAFTTNLLDIYTRPLSSSTVYWQATDWIKGNIYQTPNLASTVRAVQNLSGWTENNPMVFVIGGSGDRKAFSFEGSPNQSPRLYIKYDYGTGAAPDLGPEIEICQGDTVLLNAGSQFNLYEWNGVQNLNDSLLPVATASHNYVWVRSGSNNHVIGFDSVSVNVSSKPLLNLVSDTVVCVGNSPVVKVSGAYDSYEWSTGSVDSQTVLTQAGVYYLTVNDGACEVIDSISLDNYSVSVIDIPADTLVEDSFLVLDVFAPYFLSYEWSNGDQTSITKIDSSGLYSVIVQDTNLCSYEYFINVDFKNPIDSSVNTVIESINSEEYKIYPNPTEQFLNIKYTGESKLNGVNVYDLKGRQLLSLNKIESENIQINLNFLKSGVYFVELRLQNNTRQIGKILKL